MAFTLRYAPQARKDLDRLEAETLQRILAALEELRANPQTGGTLRGKKVGRRKVRVGDYRIRYDIVGAFVDVYRVRHRREVYRD